MGVALDVNQAFDVSAGASSMLPDLSLQFTTTLPLLTQRWKCSLEWNSCQWSLVEVTSFTSNMDFRNFMEFLRSNMSGYLGNLHKSLLSTLHLIFLDIREGMIGGWISVCVWMADVDLAHESSLPVSFLSISSQTALYIFIYLLPNKMMMRRTSLCVCLLSSFAGRGR